MPVAEETDDEVTRELNFENGKIFWLFIARK